MKTIELMLKGKSNRDIAEIMKRPEKNIYKLKNDALRKLGISDTTLLMRFKDIIKKML